MIGIVDYNAGNIKSVERALGFLKAQYVLSKNPADLEKCDRLIFPGVGEAKYAMEQLKKTGFDSFLRDWAAAGKPLVGICLGSQIIFEHSEEGDVDCLGLLKGEIKHFDSVWGKIPVSEHGNDNTLSLSGLTRQSLKVPHMGWNNLEYVNGSSPLFNGVDTKSDFYFVHSYLIQPSDETIVKAYANYGCPVPACVSSGSITAFQFHPEKSGKAGLKILENYIK
ncbi:MAG: imidazole glycerol phosphate synthase subunit HisH [Treponema sp.]|nr:imidazole glycerol phosphate synthase subunit HisH [Treponema sp.]